MPQVPYDPVPKTTPQDRPLPSFRISTPEAAFGGDIGQAIQEFGGRVIQKGAQVERLGAAEIGVGEQEAGLGRAKVALGGVAEHVGTQLADAAEAYQRLNNETWAKNKSVEAETQLGMEKANFALLEGQNAWNAYPGYQARIRAIRQEALDGAPNLESRRMLDNDLARRVAFALIDGGAHAGQQAKKAADDAAGAKIKSAQDNFNLDDPNEAQWALKTIRDNVRARGEHAGAEKITIDTKVLEEQSKAILNGIKRIVYKNPELGRSTYELYKDKMTAPEAEQAEIAVLRGEASTGSRIDADRILNGDTGMEPFDPSKGPGQLQKFEAEAKRLGESKDNPYYKDNLEYRVRAKVNLGVQGYRDTQAGNLLDLENFVMGDNPNGKIVDMDAINGPNADPKITAIYDSLDGKNKKAVERFIGSANKNIPYTRERQVRFNELMGMATEQPEEFKQLALIDEDLPRAKLDQLMARKRQIMEKTRPDTGTQHAVSVVRDLAREAGVYPKQDDPDRMSQWNQFTGGMEVEVNNFKELHTKAPNDRDLKDMARKLLKEVITAPGTVWNTYERRFEVKVPEKSDDPNVLTADTIRKAFRNVHGYNPTDDEIRMEYLAIKKFPERR